LESHQGFGTARSGIRPVTQSVSIVVAKPRGIRGFEIKHRPSFGLGRAPLGKKYGRYLYSTMAKV
jgi:hypothetical protein